MAVINSKLWLDSLYFRLAETREPDEPFPELIRVEGKESQVWITRTMLQGNGDKVQDCVDCALDVGDEAMVYAQGVS